MPDSSCLVPAFVVLAILCGLCARIDVYSAFVRGAQEGLVTLVKMLPYLCAVLTAVSLLRETGALGVLEAALSPLMEVLGVPREAAGVVLLRPLSGSAALAAVRDVLAHEGAESRAGRLACVISGASETILFTGSLYLGAAGVRRPGYALGAALAGYAVSVAAAGWLIAG